MPVQGAHGCEQSRVGWRGEIRQGREPNPAQPDPGCTARRHRLKLAMVNLRVDDHSSAQPLRIGVERAQQQAVVGAIEARRGQHPARHPARVKKRNEILDPDVMIRLCVARGLDRHIFAHHVGMRVDRACGGVPVGLAGCNVHQDASSAMRLR